MTLPASANDAELLRRFADAHSEEAFGELVRRHLNVVHSAALRQVGGNPAAAADVAQAVFTELARQAGRLARHPALVGWLYTATHRLAARHIRDETRRQRRELEAHAMQELHRDNPALEADWHRIQPVLDEAMHALGEADRLALLLRHFERRPFAEVGTRLGLSENAARMRVERALEKLRGRLAKSGITSTAAALALALSGSAVAAAPAGLAATVTTTAVATASLSITTTTTTTGLITLMASTKLKVAVGLTLFTAAVGPLLVHHRAYHHLVGENARLRNEVADLREQTLSVEPAAAVTAPAFDPDELLRLRGLVAQLQREKAELAGRLKPVAAAPTQPAPPLPLQSFSARVQAQLPVGHTVVTGGWPWKEGHRGVLLMTPLTHRGDDGGQVVEIESQIMVLPEAAFRELGLAQPDASATEVTGHRILAPAVIKGLIDDLKGRKDVEFLNSARLITPDGRQASVGVTGDDVPDAVVYDVLPTLAGDGSIALSLTGRVEPVKRHGE